jgi:D-alanyl-D-alanine dipeptidase
MKNKIMKGCFERVLVICFFSLLISRADAQNLPVSSFGLPYINSISLYKESLINHPEKQMISLLNISGIVLNLVYASNNNFMHKKLYKGNIKTTFLRKPAYDALDSVSRYLAENGLVLVIYDAYRPYSVTEKLWDKVKDEKYTANPSKGSGHNRGIAVDLTLADLKTHKLLPMPTGFDNFSDSAHQDFNELDVHVIANRNLLKNVMEKFGFKQLTTEWWHFSWPDNIGFEVLDLDFDQLDSYE